MFLTLTGYVYLIMPLEFSYSATVVMVTKLRTRRLNTAVYEMVSVTKSRQYTVPSTVVRFLVLSG